MNSEGGSLLIGVLDSGMVCGVKVDHETEDQACLHVDNAIKTFNPTLLPYNYTLDFLSAIGVKRNNLNVSCITFRRYPTSYNPVLFQSGSVSDERRECAGALE